MAGLSGFLVSWLAVHTSMLSYPCGVAYGPGLTVGQDVLPQLPYLLLCGTSEQTLGPRVPVPLPTSCSRRCLWGPEAVFNGLFACVSFLG